MPVLFLHSINGTSELSITCNKTVGACQTGATGLLFPEMFSLDGWTRYHWLNSIMTMNARINTASKSSHDISNNFFV